MKTILYYICQALLGLAFYNLAYMATLRLDFFEWGNSQNDGLYMLIVPLVLLPTILISSIIKYFVTKRLPIEDIYKWTFIGLIILSLICTFLAVADALWPTVVISLLATVAIVIETVIVARKLWTKRIKIEA
jgi:hypothetical protein